MGRPRRWIPRRIALLALAAPLAACGGSDAALRVDGVAWTEEELLGLDARRRARLAGLAALGIAVARDEVGRLGAPLLERRGEDRVLERFRAALALERAEVGEEVLRAHYETNPRHELVVRHVVALAGRTAPEEVRDSARAKAERALERIRSGDPFARVAADLSEEPGAAERGGRLRPGRRGSWVPEFWRAASALEESEVSGVVRTEYGFHVLRLEERRTVPFEEVRHEVALEATGMIGGSEEAWAAWADSVGASVAVDTAALRGWLRGSVPDSAVLADGPGSSYDGAAFAAFLATRSEERWRELRGGPVAGAAQAVAGEAVRAAAVEAARGREIAPPPGTEETLAREWETRAMGWAASLGFEGGLSLDEVKARARDALGTTRQNARIARDEAAERGPLLRFAYPVEGLEPPRPPAP
ncbi:MAG TPA: peptidylprolyl isomerase [Longimicrobiales bacterium]|nr:peptidylprolyl isomerase [Longimicrobiales bacterium]